MDNNTPEAIWIHFESDIDFWNNYGYYSGYSSNNANLSDGYSRMCLFGGDHFEGENDELCYPVRVSLNSTDEFLETREWITEDYMPQTLDWLQVERVVTHEIGHTLGLGHLQNSSEISVMNQNAILCNSNYHLTNYDINFIRKLYDPCIGAYIEEKDINYSVNPLNFPNPFNPNTTISYGLRGKIVSPHIDIYNLKGQKIKTLSLEEKEGKNSILWTGTDENDSEVGTGIYFYRLTNNGKSEK